MVAAAAHDVRVRTEIRGAPTRLFREAEGEIILSGAAGTGKTRAILEWIHARCQRERLSVLILRKTLESLKGSAMVTFQQQVLAGFDGRRSALDGVTYFGGNTIRPAQFTYDDTGSTIVMGGMDNTSKVLSTERDIVYVNEATELSLDEWEQLTGRTDRPSLAKRPPSLVIGDCNPDAPRHWIRSRAAAGKLQLWDSRHEDNPAMWDRDAQRWTDAGARYIARLDKLTGVRYQRLRLNRWVAAEGQVFDAWVRATHVVTAADLPRLGLDAPKSHVAGVDWGYTKPGVVTVWAVGGDGQIAMVREVYRTRRGQDWWVEQAKGLYDAYGIERFVCDPSEPAYIQAFVDAGLPAVPAQNAILPGITAVQQRLEPDGTGRPRLFVLADANRNPDPDLVADEKLPAGSLDEVDVYVWAQDMTGRKEKPVDANNHGMDTWRYVAMYLEDRPAEWADVAAETDLGAFFGGR